MIDLKANRRQLLAGLAVAAADRHNVAETPALIALAATLPAAVDAFLSALRAYEECVAVWKARTPLAPDFMTAMGTERWTGQAEKTAFGDPLVRDGEKYPRLIVITRWKIEVELDRARLNKRRAKKAGDLAGFGEAEDEINRIKPRLAAAVAYKLAFEAAEEAAEVERERVIANLKASWHTFAVNVLDTMFQEERTLEGVLIKAEALERWGGAEKRMRPLLTNTTLSGWWFTATYEIRMKSEPLLAASLLRHAGAFNGGASNVVTGTDKSQAQDAAAARWGGLQVYHNGEAG